VSAGLVCPQGDGGQRDEPRCVFRSFARTSAAASATFEPADYVGAEPTLASGHHDPPSPDCQNPIGQLLYWILTSRKEYSQTRTLLVVGKTSARRSL
jgi:hypothetical protein